MLLAGGLDMKATLAGKQHYLLYCLTPAMKPRMLMTGRPPPPPRCLHAPAPTHVMRTAHLHLCPCLQLHYCCLRVPHTLPLLPAPRGLSPGRCFFRLPECAWLAPSCGLHGEERPNEAGMPVT